MSQPNNNLISIQFLRGIASLLVVLCHLSGMAIGSFHTEFLFNIFRFGETGVDIFFVISGFIITYTSFKNIEKAGMFELFIKKRLIRIFPTYWVIITVLIFLQISLPAFYNTPYLFSAQNIAATYSLLPGHPKIIVVTWTLTYELFFYALFSLGFVFHNKKLLLILFTVYGLIIIWFALSGLYIQKNNEWLHMISSPLIIEFLLGVLAALIVVKLPNSSALPLLISGVVLFLIFGSIVSSENYPQLNSQLSNQTFGRVLMFGVPSFLILIGLVKYELFKKIKTSRMFFSLGEASYSLYLIHLPALAAIFKFLTKLNIHNAYLLHLLLIITVMAICWSSILINRYIEKPTMQWLNNIGKKTTFTSK